MNVMVKEHSEWHNSHGSNSRWPNRDTRQCQWDLLLTTTTKHSNTFLRNTRLQRGVPGELRMRFLGGRKVERPRTDHTVYPSPPRFIIAEPDGRPCEAYIKRSPVGNSTIVVEFTGILPLRRNKRRSDMGPGRVPLPSTRLYNRFVTSVQTM